ncbi:LamG domain-containing protein [Actinoplanes sp. NEAU-A12]|uniref:LamG domain-containing protein n=1 Tax=Actinoplanes sandaracinus TaxID=3045177 RepID=A0ABT6WN47_9ACTN|nr:LamG-like jellyroll fold domain-containing protein [Actinoplanes sandaracinus]MDI6101160.1 LamG domain-containing protein [Actinoplanes sandaracinus]
MRISRLSALTVLITLPLLGAPATAAIPVVAPTAVEPTGPALVARYNFDGGATAGKISELSGRGAALTVRGSANGQIAFTTEGAGRFASFPGICAATATTCAKALLEAPDDVDLDPGLRNFKWAASVRINRTQLSGNANVMQKGVANTGSQWKMQIGGRTGRAQCVLVARGTGQTFSVLSAKPVADGGWHRIVCERTGTTLALSVDGVPGARTTLPATAAVDNAMPLRIGGPNLAKDGDMYHGQLDDIYAQLG